MQTRLSLRNVEYYIAEKSQDNFVNDQTVSKILNELRIVDFINLL